MTDTLRTLAADIVSALEAARTAGTLSAEGEVEVVRSVLRGDHTRRYHVTEIMTGDVVRFPAHCLICHGDPHTVCPSCDGPDGVRR